MVSDTVKIKEAARGELLGHKDEAAKYSCMEVYKEENRKVKRCIC